MAGLFNELMTRVLGYDGYGNLEVVRDPAQRHAEDKNVALDSLVDAVSLHKKTTTMDSDYAHRWRVRQFLSIDLLREFGSPTKSLQSRRLATSGKSIRSIREQCRVVSDHVAPILTSDKVAERWS